MKKIISFIIPFIALFIVLLIPYTYIYQGSIREVLDGVLHLKADPVFSGGEVMVKFMDPVGDDYGEGTLTYPGHQGFNGKGFLDVVRYTIYEPVVNARWSNELDFWQLAVTFANVGNPFDAPLGFSHPVIHVYIDIDGDRGGSTDTVFPRAELVAFDNTHPWDFMVHIDGYSGSGTIISYDKTFKRPVSIIYVEEKKTVYARILLEDKRLKQVLDGRATYHYVLVGAYDRLASGNFMAVKKTVSMGNGGGAPSRLSPRVYDMVEPSGTNQKKYLSSYSEATYEYAKLVPLEVKKVDLTMKKTNVELLAKYKKQLQEERKNKKPVDLSARIKQLVEKGVKGTELAIVYYQAKMLSKAEEEFLSVLQDNPGNATALAYLGTITAIKARKEKSLSRAMQNVNQAFEFYEKAISGCKTDDERVTVLLHRANVSVSVPEEVFHKTIPGAVDFLKAAGILERIRGEDRNLIIDCYLEAALAYERASKPEEAEIYFTKVMSFKNLITGHIVILLERGYDISRSVSQ
jgi:carbohydrate-binding DOMON domain-containing protein